MNLSFKRDVACVIALTAKTFDKDTFRVTFNMNSGRIVPLKPTALSTYDGKIMFLWPLAGNEHDLKFEPCRGILRDKGKGYFVLELVR